MFPVRNCLQYKTLPRRIFHVHAANVLYNIGKIFQTLLSRGGKWLSFLQSGLKLIYFSVDLTISNVLMFSHSSSSPSLFLLLFFLPLFLSFFIHFISLFPSLFFNFHLFSSFPFSFCPKDGTSTVDSQFRTFFPPLLFAKSFLLHNDKNKTLFNSRIYLL